MVEFSSTFRSASPEQVTCFENLYSVELPADYKQFLCSTNGGVPDPNCFYVPDRGDALCDVLYGLHDKREPTDLDWEQEQANQWDPLPRGFVVIGHDPGGSSLLLATCGEQAGTVYFWDRNGLWIREDGHNTFPVANSFSAFLAGLREMQVQPELESTDRKPAKRRRTKR